MATYWWLFDNMIQVCNINVFWFYILLVKHTYKQLFWLDFSFTDTYRCICTNKMSRVENRDFAILLASSVDVECWTKHRLDSTKLIWRDPNAFFAVYEHIASFLTLYLYGCLHTCHCQKKKMDAIMITTTATTTRMSEKIENWDDLPWLDWLG